MILEMKPATTAPFTWFRRSACRSINQVNATRRDAKRGAHFVKSLWFKGEWVDDLIFAMLASDWEIQEQGNEHGGTDVLSAWEELAPGDPLCSMRSHRLRVPTRLQANRFMITRKEVPVTRFMQDDAGRTAAPQLLRLSLLWDPVNQEPSRDGSAKRRLALLSIHLACRGQSDLLR